MTRQLSFAGVSFDIKELPLSRDFIEMYDASVKLVSKQEYRKYPHRSTLGRVTSNSEGWGVSHLKGSVLLCEEFLPREVYTWLTLSTMILLSMKEMQTVISFYWQTVIDLTMIFLQVIFHVFHLNDDEFAQCKIFYSLHFHKIMWTKIL